MLRPRKSALHQLALSAALAAGLALAPIAAATPLPASPASQANAVQKARDYLSYSALSRNGLIAQLEYDQFTPADATYAVDNITVDWNEQAAKKAQDYLEYSSFSHGGLVDQLEYDGFTASQAEYGTTAAGL